METFKGVKTDIRYGKPSTALVAEGLTWTDQVPQQFAPLCAELIGSSQTPISTNDTQVSDAPFNEVECGLDAPLLCLEIFTASTADDCAPLKASTCGDGLIFTN